MGGRKKKFIDKKQSATFQLLARDTSTSAPLSSSDRVFVRVDNNPYALDDALDDSIFADAPSSPPPPAPPSLPDDVRREILELGFPDDGYNYLLHLREIHPAGAGAAYFQNDRARMDLVPVDVRAYDASRLRVAGIADRDDVGMVCAVASGTVGLRVGRALDPDVARMLEEDGDGSRFGSDVEDLEEDFIAMANREEDTRGKGVEGWLGEDVGVGGYDAIPELPLVDGNGVEEVRSRRLLDAQFDLLAFREYDTGSDSDDAEYMGKNVEPLVAKLNDALKDHSIDELDLEEKYRVPADYIRSEQGSNTKLANSSVEILRKCSEYAEIYSHDDDEEREVMFCQDSSDESEVWDCETIVSTYTNLDNHPGKISAPENPRKKVRELVNGKDNIISLRGKDKIPLDFLTNGKKVSAEKMKKPGLDHSKRPLDESKEAKKERKAAVKEERREARRTKKELKQLYKSEAQKAQQVASFTGPSSIHLM